MSHRSESSAHDTTLAGTAARLKASIAWLRDGVPTPRGGIGVADMVAMLPIVETAVAADVSGERAATDPMLRYWSDWYSMQSLKGDPARRGNLARDAYLSGAAQGALLARATSVKLREPLPGVSTSGWLQTVQAPGTTKLQWDEAAPQPHACAREVGARCETPCGLTMCRPVDSSDDLHGKPVDEIANSHGQVVDAEFPGTPTIAECIAQLDVWNGHLEAAIDRQALEQLGQHENDEPFVVGRDPMEQLP